MTVHPGIRIEPLDGPVGAIVHGLTPDRAPTGEEFAMVEQAMFDHIAIVIPELAHQYRHRWREGMLLGLDNRSSMHCAIDDYTEPRRMLRMIVGCTDGSIGEVAEDPEPKAVD